MSYYFQSYREEIKSIKKQRDEVRKNLNLINEQISWVPEHQNIPLDLIKNKEKQEARLVELSESLGRLLQTGADLSNMSKGLVLAPYLLDRLEQEFAFFQAFKEVNKRANKLLVCLIHGDKQQSHDMFVECLKVYFLPKQIKEPEITIYHLQFPETLKNFDDQLQYNLAKTILKSELTESNEVINNFLVQSPAPVIIDAYMYCNHWLKDSGEAIKKFLYFWESWPVISAHQPLFVFLFIIHNNKQHHGIFERLRFLFADRGKSRLNKEIEQLLYTFSSSNFSQFNNFCGVVLPKLKGITEQEATEWVDIVGRKHFPDNLAFVKDTKLEIQAIFNQWKSKDLPKRIPMDKLAVLLSGILFDYAAIYEYSARRELP